MNVQEQIFVFESAFNAFNQRSDSDHEINRFYSHIAGMWWGEEVHIWLIGAR